jgi:hypothetical protein
VKTRTAVILSVIAAAALTVCQRATVIGGDEFSLVGPEQHKVFSYGFPFRIVESAAVFAERTPPWEIPLRLGGNFTAFLILGLSAVWIAGRLSRKAG